jgi:hypothetical protein
MSQEMIDKLKDLFPMRVYTIEMYQDYLAVAISAAAEHLDPIKAANNWLEIQKEQCKIKNLVKNIRMRTHDLSAIPERLPLERTGYTASRSQIYKRKNINNIQLRITRLPCPKRYVENRSFLLSLIEEEHVVDGTSYKDATLLWNDALADPNRVKPLGAWIKRDIEADRARIVKRWKARKRAERRAERLANG